MKHTFVLLLIIGLAAVAMADGFKLLTSGTEGRPVWIEFDISDAGDTAQVMTFHVREAVNSYPYQCTLNVGGEATVGTWTSPASGTDVAMVCDSMVNEINVNDTASLYVVAANVGDTAFTVTALKKGLAFTAQGVRWHADTLDTVHTQLNITSWSLDSATIPLSTTDGFKTLQGVVILNAEANEYAGLGNADSGALWLYTKNPYGAMIVVDSTAIAAGLPCTLAVEVPEATGDTLLEYDLWLKWLITDSCSDINFADIRYPLWMNLKLK